jgi:hypothetical protein
MMRGRSAWACAGAIGLVAAGGSVALAAGETVTTKVTVKKAVKITKKKPGQAKLLWDATIAKSDGSRPANLSGGDLTLPKGTSVDVTGLEACPLSKIEANDVKSCPAKSVVGSATGTILSAPVRDKPYDATGVVYYTGGGAKKPTFAAFYTLVEIPSAHSITALSASKTKLHFDEPRIPTAPGLPDATVLHISFSFDKKGPKGMLFKQKTACKKGTPVKTSYTFFDGSTAQGTGGSC